jgi:hypothetical protein
MISELQVLFLTDGGDNDATNTTEVSGELKSLIKKDNIYSKFSVINLGNVIAPFLV